jgi:hypothetical protein
MPSRKLKKLLLRFPEDVCLVNLASPIDKVIPADIQPYSFGTASFSVKGQIIQQWACNISWKVGNSKSRLKAFGSAQKKGVSRMSQLFASKCSMSDASD